MTIGRYADLMHAHRDRFAILGGVYPRDRCAAQLDEAERKGYATTLDVVHGLIECLSDGQSPLVRPRSGACRRVGVVSRCVVALETA